MNEEKILNEMSPSPAEADNATIVKTDEGAKDGQKKCPKCGATDISLNLETGKLRCNFCRHEFEPKKIKGLEADLTKLNGKVIASGASDINADTDDLVTLKCQSCGAEVVIDTNEAAHARCHWCRNTLSLNKQIPNGSIPDVVLPFSLKKDEAKAEIEKFAGKRKFFAHPRFKKEFTTENIMGVYFPYMLVDVNGKTSFSGEGEHETGRYTVGSGEDKETRYDADVYHVERDFDITIKELSIESSADKLDNSNKKKTNNIINSIMPFDTENCVKWNANYLKGFTSEKRDTNVDQLENLVMHQAKDVAKFKINDTLTHYDRGVRWDKKELKVEGQQWKSAYLPVWLYSYQQKKGNKSLLHYIAVNARTKETMGSIPIHMPKLLSISAIIEIIGLILMIFVDFGEDAHYKLAFLLPGILFFTAIYLRYRNANARHTYETETISEIDNLVMVDDFIRKEEGLKESIIRGSNNRTIDTYDSYGNQSLFTNAVDIAKPEILDKLDGNTEMKKFIKKNIDKYSK